MRTVVRENPQRFKRIHAAEIATSLPAMARAMSHASAVVTAIDHTNWPLFEGLKSVPAGANILASLSEGIESDEHVHPLADRLRECSGEAARLLLERVPPPPPPPPGKHIVSTIKKQSVPLTDTLGELRRVAEAHPNAEIDIEWEIRE